MGNFRVDSMDAVLVDFDCFAMVDQMVGGVAAESKEVEPSGLGFVEPLPQPTCFRS